MVSCSAIYLFCFFKTLLSPLSSSVHPLLTATYCRHSLSPPYFRLPFFCRRIFPALTATPSYCCRRKLSTLTPVYLSLFPASFALASAYNDHYNYYRVSGAMIALNLVMAELRVRLARLSSFSNSSLYFSVRCLPLACLSRC